LIKQSRKQQRFLASNEIYIDMRSQGGMLLEDLMKI